MRVGTDAVPSLKWECEDKFVQLYFNSLTWCFPNCQTEWFQKLPLFLISRALALGNLHPFLLQGSIVVG